MKNLLTVLCLAVALGEVAEASKKVRRFALNLCEIVFSFESWFTSHTTKLPLVVVRILFVVPVSRCMFIAPEKAASTPQMGFRSPVL